MTDHPGKVTMISPEKQEELTLLTRAMLLFNCMPYGGMAHFTWTSDTLARTTPTLADVVDNLERLRATLARVADGDQERDTELYRLRHYTRSIRGLMEEADRLADVTDETAFPADAEDATDA